MTTAQEPTWRPKVDPAVVGVIAVLAMLLSGRYVTAPNLAWYATLAKPSFNPPDWVFAPVWGLLYLLMAVAIWRVMQKPPSAARTAGVARAVAAVAARNWRRRMAWKPLCYVVVGRRAAAAKPKPAACKAVSTSFSVWAAHRNMLCRG